MKKVILGLFAIVIAVSGSAFTSKSDIEKTLAPITYRNIGGGTYSLTAPGPCATSDANQCLLTFSNPNNVTNPPATVTLSSLPTNLGSSTQSGGPLRQ